MTVNNLPSSDSRQQFNTFIQNLPSNMLNNTTDLPLKEAFDINRFKNDFNNFLGLVKEKNLFIDDIFIHIPIYSKLSRTIKQIIDMMHYTDHQFGNKNTQQKNNIVKLRRMWRKTYLYNNNYGTININDNYYRSNGQSIFQLYNRLIEIENFDTENSEKKKLLKELALLVMKYFFLTEVLLKILLDTNYNNNNGNDNISNNYTNYGNEIGFASFSPFSQRIRFNECNYAGIPKTVIRNRGTFYMKNIYSILQEINKKYTTLINLSNEYTINNNEITELNNTISKLDDDKKKFMHHSKILKEKQDYTKKNNNKEQRQLIILLILTIILIFANLFIFLILKNSQSLIFQINIIIIVIIIITKFYYLLK
tara:strand:- start:48 stop:1145 length:1098 start_codon:yes stop_codon:yes gene_type:complete